MKKTLVSSSNGHLDLGFLCFPKAFDQLRVTCLLKLLFFYRESCTRTT